MQTLHVTYGYHFYHWKLKLKFSLHIHIYINNVRNKVKNNIKTTLLHMTVSVHEKISYHIHTNLFRKCILLLVEKCVIWNCNFWFENFETVLLFFTKLTLLVWDKVISKFHRREKVDFATPFLNKLVNYLTFLKLDRLRSLIMPSIYVEAKF